MELIKEFEVHRKFMKPFRTKPYISIAIPASIISDAKTLREQTLKIGFIGRTAAIFRVEDIYIYNDSKESKDSVRFIQSVLNYMEIPPYMKKIIVPITSELRYAGLLPPLKTPHHVSPDVFDTIYREGIVVNRFEDRCVVEIGLDKKGIVRGRCPNINARVTVKIVNKTSRYYYVEIVDRSILDIYWGYRVHVIDSLKKLLIYSQKNNYLIVIASKKGKPVYENEKNFASDMINKEKIVLIFGSPYLDVDEIASEEQIDITAHSNYIINFIPRQGVENVRTEEAIIAVLSIINYLKEKYIDRQIIEKNDNDKNTILNNKKNKIV